MALPVEKRRIFHLTHLDNLSAIIADGCLWSDHEVAQRPRRRTVIGFATVKKRRLEERTVSCHPGTFVGQYVPFYFCPRAPMLYVIHRKNSELMYQGGQDRIVHLVSTIEGAIQSAGGRPWAFSDGNAGARYTLFSSNLSEFDSVVSWSAVTARYWSDPAIKERKQAEFLVFGSFPWSSILEIGVINQQCSDDVRTILAGADHRPQVVVKPKWYY